MRDNSPQNPEKNQRKTWIKPEVLAIIPKSKIKAILKRYSHV